MHYPKLTIGKPDDSSQRTGPSSPSASGRTVPLPAGGQISRASIEAQAPSGPSP
jgi:hypothetical protein